MRNAQPKSKPKSVRNPSTTRTGIRISAEIYRAIQGIGRYGTRSVRLRLERAAVRLVECIADSDTAPERAHQALEEASVQCARILVLYELLDRAGSVTPSQMTEARSLVRELATFLDGRRHDGPPGGPPAAALILALEPPSNTNEPSPNRPTLPPTDPLAVRWRGDGAVEGLASGEGIVSDEANGALAAKPDLDVTGVPDDERTTVLLGVTERKAVQEEAEQVPCEPVPGDGGPADEGPHADRAVVHADDLQVAESEGT